MRNPEGVWDCLCKIRRDIKTLVRFLTCREMYIYFKDCSVVKSHKLSGVIERHCVSLDFLGDMEESDVGEFQGKVANYISRTVGEHSNSEPTKNNLGNRAFMMARK